MDRVNERYISSPITSYLIIGSLSYSGIAWLRVIRGHATAGSHYMLRQTLEAFRIWTR